jgi:hypothetical protein
MGIDNVQAFATRIIVNAFLAGSVTIDVSLDSLESFLVKLHRSLAHHRRDALLLLLYKLELLGFIHCCVQFAC